MMIIFTCGVGAFVLGMLLMIAVDMFDDAEGWACIVMITVLGIFVGFLITGGECSPSGKAVIAESYSLSALPIGEGIFLEMIEGDGENVFVYNDGEQKTVSGDETEVKVVDGNNTLEVLTVDLPADTCPTKATYIFHIGENALYTVTK